MTLASVAAALALASGCTIYRGFTPVTGRVVDATSGEPVPGARLTACLVDLHPRSIVRDCASSRWTRQTVTDASGDFRVSGSRHFGVFDPRPHQGFPGPYGTSLLIEKDGYVARELDWRRDAALSSGEDVLIPLEPRAGAPP